MKKEVKGLLYIFYFLSICFVLLSLISNRNIYSDGPGLYLGDIYNILVNNDNPFIIIFHRPFEMVRFFSYIVQRLIFILLYPFFGWNITANFTLYSISFLVMPYICLFLNFLIAKRTQRYDIAVFALAFFCLFSLPYSAWLARELPIALMFQFLLLQFFLSRKKFTKIDLVIISFLVLFQFESFENMTMLSILYVIFGIIYYKKKVVNYKIRLFIAILNIFIFFYMCFRTLYATLNSDFIEKAYDNVIPWMLYLSVLPDSTKYTCIIVSVVSFLLILFCIGIRFSKVKFNIIMVLTFIFSIVMLYIKTKFIPNPGLESGLFMYSIILSPIIFSLFMLFDLYKIKISKYNLREILIIILITGCIQLLWQINSCKYFYQYFYTLKNCMLNSTEKFVSYHFLSDGILSEYDTTNDTIMRSIIIANGHPKALIIPDKKHPNYRDIMYKNFINHYDDSNKTLCLFNICLNLESKYWDLTPIVETNADTLQKEIDNLNYLYSSNGNN